MSPPAHSSLQPEASVPGLDGDGASSWRRPAPPPLADRRRRSSLSGRNSPKLRQACYRTAPGSRLVSMLGLQLIKGRPPAAERNDAEIEGVQDAQQVAEGDIGDFVALKRGLRISQSDAKRKAQLNCPYLCPGSCRSSALPAPGKSGSAFCRCVRTTRPLRSVG